MKIMIILILILLSAPPIYPGGTVTALCYHSFFGLQRDNYDFPPAELENQIQSLLKMGYRFVSFNEMLENKVYGNSNILITLDDGSRSIRNIYRNIFKKYGIKPLFFIYPSVIGRRHYALTYSDLKKYEKEGASIGAHGYNHLFVNEKLYEKDRVSFNREIYKSKEVLEKNLPAPVAIFAYPFGIYSDITIENIQNARYQYAFSIDPGNIKVPLDKNENRYNLHRYLITKSSWKYIFRMLRENARPDHVLKRKSNANT